MRTPHRIFFSCLLCLLYLPAVVGQVMLTTPKVDSKIGDRMTINGVEYALIAEVPKGDHMTLKINDIEYALIAIVPKDGSKAGERIMLTIKGVEYAFRWCPAGTFVMGSPENDDRYPDDKNWRDKGEVQHQVTLSRGFWMLETEVTQAMWESVMDSNPSKFKGSKHPVENVSWDDCQEYIEKLNDLGIVPPGFEFSLPTEAQWEYACRAGTTTTYAFGNALNQNQANFLNGVGHTREVGSYRANAWGLRDMHGNVSEWCLDVYGTYSSEAVTDPTDPVVVTYETARVVRDGDFYNYKRYCRSAYRSWRAKSSPSSSHGLRLALVRTVEEP